VTILGSLTAGWLASTDLPARAIELGAFGATLMLLSWCAVRRATPGVAAATAWFCLAVAAGVGTRLETTEPPASIREMVEASAALEHWALLETRAGGGGSGAAICRALSSPDGWRVLEEPWSVRLSGFAPGEQLVMRGVLRPPSSPGSAWRFDAREAYALAPSRAGWGDRCAMRADSSRAKLAKRLDAALGADVGALAAWCLLDVQPEGDITAWIEPFRRTGTIHLLSISGFHLTLVAGGCLLFARIVARGWSGSCYLALGAVAAYVAWVGAPAPAIRAAGMAFVLTMGPGFGRTQRSWNALGWAVTFVALLEPASLFRPGFVLSVSAMAGVFCGGGIAQAARASVPPLVRSTLELAGASCGAFALTAPWSFHYFGELYPLGAIANLAVVPAMAIGFPPLVVGALAVSVGAEAGHPLVAAARFAGDAVMVLVRMGSPPCSAFALRGALDAAGAAALAVSIAVFGLITLKMLLREPRRDQPGRPKRRLLAWWRSPAPVALCFCALAVFAIARGDPALEPRLEDGGWSVTYLDIGQGDAILIRLPEATWLVDVGPPRSGARTVASALTKRRIDRLDRVYLTHGDLDHWGGLPGLIASTIAVDTLVLPSGMEAPEGLTSALATAMSSARRAPELVTVAAGWRRAFPEDGLLCEAAHPFEGERAARKNDGSVVLRLSDSTGRALLLSGDLEETGQSHLLERGRVSLDALVAHAGHHGSRTSAADAWLDRVGARLAVASLARGNKFGFPHSEVITAWRERGGRILRTDERGAVTVGVGRQGWYVHTERPRGPHEGGVL